MSENYERQMKKGALDMLVLKLLESAPKYGYQLISEMREKSEGVFTLKEGTFYPILYRLEEDKLVESKWSKSQGKQVPRKYYMITEKGKETIPQIEKVWRQISAGVNRIMEEE